MAPRRHLGLLAALDSLIEELAEVLPLLPEHERAVVAARIGSSVRGLAADLVPVGTLVLLGTWTHDDGVDVAAGRGLAVVDWTMRMVCVLRESQVRDLRERLAFGGDPKQRHYEALLWMRDEHVDSALYALGVRDLDPVARLIVATMEAAWAKT